ncbi:MAG: DUF1003 domain-containing protein [Euryarchaeota archaeon]|nr:DUF1003 domain-containing protein [Euryarchaeota archaeon]
MCGKVIEEDQAVMGDAVRAPIVEVIRGKHPGWSPDGYICINDLNRFRAEYVRHILEAEKGELTALERDVLKSIQEQELMSRDINADIMRRRTMGEKVADKFAAFGGSWTFIAMFGAFILTWIAINSFALLARPYDPYPYILLNLFLSTLAALQAPIIMMSQNRQAMRDRLHAEQDYRVNLKAELEVRHLNEKMDHLLMRQWQRLLDIQEIQTEIMHGLSSRPKDRAQTTPPPDQ